MQLNLKENMPSNMQTTEQIKIGNLRERRGTLIQNTDDKLSRNTGKGKQKILKPILENFTKPSDLSLVNKKQTTGTCMVTCIRETIGFEIKENVTPQGLESKILRSANVEYRHILPFV